MAASLNAEPDRCRGLCCNQFLISVDPQDPFLRLDQTLFFGDPISSTLPDESFDPPYEFPSSQRRPSLSSFLKSSSEVVNLNPSSLDFVVPQSSPRIMSFTSPASTSSRSSVHSSCTMSPSSLDLSLSPSTFSSPSPSSRVSVASSVSSTSVSTSFSRDSLLSPPQLIDLVSDSPLDSPRSISLQHHYQSRSRSQSNTQSNSQDISSYRKLDGAFSSASSLFESRLSVPSLPMMQLQPIAPPSPQSKVNDFTCEASRTVLAPHTSSISPPSLCSAPFAFSTCASTSSSAQSRFMQSSVGSWLSDDGRSTGVPSTIGFSDARSTRQSAIDSDPLGPSPATYSVVYIPVRSLFDRPWLDQLFGLPFFQWVVIGYLFGCVSALSLGYPNSLLTGGIYLGCLVIMASLHLSRVDSRLVRMMLQSFETMYLWLWGALVMLATALDEFSFARSAAAAVGSSIHNTSAFDQEYGALIHAISVLISQLTLFQLTIGLDSLPRLPRNVKTASQLLILAWAFFNWMDVRFLRPGRLSPSAFCIIGNVLACSNTIRLRLDGWAVLSLFFMRNLIQQYVYDEERFVVIKSMLVLSRKRDLLLAAAVADAQQAQRPLVQQVADVDASRFPVQPRFSASTLSDCSVESVEAAQAMSSSHEICIMPIKGCPTSSLQIVDETDADIESEEVTESPLNHDDYLPHSQVPVTGMNGSNPPRSTVELVVCPQTDMHIPSASSIIPPAPSSSSNVDILPENDEESAVCDKSSGRDTRRLKVLNNISNELITSYFDHDPLLDATFCLDRPANQNRIRYHRHPRRVAPSPSSVSLSQASSSSANRASSSLSAASLSTSPSAHGSLVSTISTNLTEPEVVISAYVRRPSCKCKQIIDRADAYLMQQSHDFMSLFFISNFMSLFRSTPSPIAATINNSSSSPPHTFPNSSLPSPSSSAIVPIQNLDNQQTHSDLKETDPVDCSATLHGTSKENQASESVSCNSAQADDYDNDDDDDNLRYQYAWLSLFCCRSYLWQKRARVIIVSLLALSIHALLFCAEPHTWTSLIYIFSATVILMIWSLRRMDSRIVLYLFRNFEYSFLMISALFEFAANVIHVSLDTAYIGRIWDHRTPDVLLWGMLLWQVVQWFYTIIALSVDALRLSVPCRSLVLTGWVGVSFLRLCFNLLTNMIIERPHRFCIATECFELASIRVHLQVTLLLYGIRYCVLSFFYPHAMTVLRTSLLFTEVSTSDLSESADSVSILTPGPPVRVNPSQTSSSKSATAASNHASTAIPSAVLASTPVMMMNTIMRHQQNNQNN